MTAIRSEYSLFERDAARDLGIGFVPFPLGRRFLTGTYERVEDVPEGDSRRNLPRCSEEAIRALLRIVGALGSLPTAWTAPPPL